MDEVTSENETVTLCVPDVARFTLFDEKLHAVFAGSPEQDNSTVPLKLFCELRERVALPGWLAVTVTVLAEA